MNALKVLFYVAIGFAAMFAAILAITGGQAATSHPVMLFAIFALFAIVPVGAFWMMYQSIRYDKKPFSMILMAMFLPFSFVWYYFERVRPGKVRRRRYFA